MTDPARRSEASALPVALLGFAIFSIGDGLVRSMAGQWPGSAIALLRYAIATGVLGAFLAWREGRAGFRCPLPLVQLGRGAALAFATTAFFAALGLMPLADATAVSFTTPMWAALLSALLLGERVGWRRVAVILLAFAGVLLILQPKVAAIGPVAMLPLFSAAMMAALMMLNRRVARAGSVLSSQFFVAAIATALLIPITIVGDHSGSQRFEVAWPSAMIIAKCAGVAVTGTTGHWLIYIATTRASAASIAPMNYVQILVAITIGWAVFGSVPSVTMLIGAAVIVGAGLLLFRMSGRGADDVGETGVTPE
ncbi:MAG: Threonine/homoserine efflux transporter RhtA [Rhizorhabdus sp.]|nr:Threonine/homoserine efflux transporter RhtA [Rhizorhabdus sp.]